MPGTGEPISDSDALHPFSSELEAWEAGYQLLSELCSMRSLNWQPTPTPPRHADAAAAIRAYCRRLRLSPRQLSLARLQREAPLTDEHVVIVIAALAGFWSGMLPTRYQQVGLLAFGLSPVRLHRYCDEVQSRHGIGRYVAFRDGMLYPTRELFRSVYRPMKDKEFDILRDEASNLPTAPPERSDIPDNQHRKEGER